MPRKKPDLSLLELVAKFAATKKSSITINGFARYTAALFWIRRLCPELLVKNIKQLTIDNLRDKMTKAMESDRLASGSDRPVNNKTVLGYFQIIRAAIVWDCERREIPDPIWKIKKPTAKVAKKKPKSFTPAEVVQILQSFQSDRSEYFDYVYFLLSTAVRPNEINALTWNKVSPDFGRVNIDCSHSRGIDKDSTKTGVERTVYLAPDVSEMLRRRSHSLSGLIFTDGQGRAIDDRRFRRIWQRVLIRAGIPYLKPYCTRSSAISIALNNGADPVKLAAAAGHDPVTMFKFYGNLISTENPFVSLASLR